MSRSPAPVSEIRRLTSAVIDGLFALSWGLAAAFIPLTGPRFWIAILGALLGASFLNHVVLAALGLASIGKLLTGLRLVRDDNGAPPGLMRLIRRWLVGFVWVIIVVPISIAADSDVNQEELGGLRLIQR